MLTDAEARRVVDGEWCAQLGVSIADLKSGGVHVVTVDIGANDAMSFRLEDTCIVAVRAHDLERSRRLVEGLGADAVFTADFLRRLVGPNARVDGPSSHNYVTSRTFKGHQDDDVVRLDLDDDRVFAFLRQSDVADWAEGGFALDPSAEDPSTTSYYGLFDGGDLVAAGNMTAWRGLPADVGLLTRPDARGRGLATRLAGSMTGDALPVAGVVRYRVLITNGRSLAVARRLGFEEYGQNFRARRGPE
jgi:RimJ/RimL family protein N-acetyltransferase